MAESCAPSCIHINLQTLPSAAQEPMHLLPCEIQREGPANIDKYFSPAILDGKVGKEVSFRGRSLRGQEVTVPSGYLGIVLREDHKPCSDEEDRSLTVRSTFNSFTQWNLETPPSADDAIMMSMMWSKIASAIHEPVE
ncbi:ribonuclease H2 subunit C [Bombina bombina]|uniref:ribonuclease H2 subunit C n=1 Tax=Bombina bombina TaxID=8345 RepID=UPI00235A5CF9|nr:ribonuclease H2 subunit C [Bombina bombina]XP_053575991.1 ribonuclease H2 subunit C [Bombina bombina]XP_053575992.1 ribonuclease H2 subunit C [Bombina bombina]